MDSHENSSIIELKEEEVNKLLFLSEQLARDPSENADSFCKFAKQLSIFVPQRIREKLANFVNHGSETGFLLIRRIPIDFRTLSKTPKDNTQRLGEKTTFAKVQAILLHVVGEMIAYEAEGCGRLFQDVIPMADMENEQTSLGSNIELEIHTEQAFSNLRPDILSLACLRGDANAFTNILPVHIILQHLSQEERAMLHEPLWKTGVDLSFKLFGQDFKEGYIRGPLSILQGENEDDPQLVFDQDLMAGLTEDANRLLHKIVDIYYRHRIMHNFKSGEIMMVDNRRAIHGRSAFYPRYNGYDRFLVRCFATLDFERSQYAREGSDKRVVQATFS
jgi:L-asparagine oxygenase